MSMMLNAFAATHSAVIGTRSLRLLPTASAVTDVGNGDRTCVPLSIHLHWLIRSLEARMSGNALSGV